MDHAEIPFKREGFDCNSTFQIIPLHSRFQFIPIHLCVSSCFIIFIFAVFKSSVARGHPTSLASKGWSAAKAVAYGEIGGQEFKKWSMFVDVCGEISDLDGLLVCPAAESLGDSLRYQVHSAKKWKKHPPHPPHPRYQNVPIVQLDGFLRSLLDNVAKGRPKPTTSQHATAGQKEQWVPCPGRWAVDFRWDVG